MRGSTYKRGDRYYIRFDIEPDPATGRRRQRSGGGYDTEREADAALAARLAASNAGAHIDASRQTVAAYCAYWLDVAMAGTVRETSLSYYRGHVAHIVAALGAHRLGAVRAGHVGQAMRRWEREGLGASTRAILHIRMRQIFRHAARDRQIAASPMDAVPAPKVEHVERIAWTPAQLARFLSLIEGEPDRAVWRLYALGGLRRGEGIGLRWRDVDWARGCVRVEQQAVQGGGPVRIGPPKSARSRRRVDLDAGTMAALSEHRAAQLARRLAHPAWRDLDLVCPAPDGSILPPTTIGDRWRTLLARHPELPAFGLHGLRHTLATILMAEDGNVRAIADRLGHDPALLLRVYAHADEAVQRRGTQRLMAALGGAGAGDAVAR